jgi:hypothetical protein
MKNILSWLYDALLWGTALLLVSVLACLTFMLFFDSSEGGIPAKMAYGNQQAQER